MSAGSTRVGFAQDGPVPTPREPGNPAAALADQFRHHFHRLSDGRDHLYTILLPALADDLEAGGPTAAICRDQLPASRGDAVQLRLLAGVFRIVLRGEAPGLARFYPVLGGHDDPAGTHGDGGAWAALLPVLAAHEEELRAALLSPPQTNEAGRSVALAAGLFEAVRRYGLRRVRLLEPGASAGLNLNLDRYLITGPGWQWGDAGSPLRLDTASAQMRPEGVTIVERRGCDLAPVDASTPDGAAYLTSFVWPFDLERHTRLAAALDVVRMHPVTVDRAPAARWLAEQLARPVESDVLTVVWQSVTQQYWPPAETAAVASVIEQTRSRIPLCHISFEGIPPVQTGGGYDVARFGPELTVDGDLIARTHHHGPPVIMQNCTTAPS